MSRRERWDSNRGAGEGGQLESSSVERGLEDGENVALVGLSEGEDGVEYSLNVSDGRLDESGVVDVDEEANEELAVHAIGDAAVAGNDLVEVLLLESALHGGREEAAEGSNDRGEESDDDGVQLDGNDGEVADEGGQDGGVGEERGQRLRREEGDCRAGTEGELHGRATEPIELGEEARAEEANHDRNDGGTNKSFPSLVWRQLGQWLIDKLAPNGHAYEVRHNVVADDQRVGQHEPEEAVVHVYRNHA